MSRSPEDLAASSEPRSEALQKPQPAPVLSAGRSGELIWAAVGGPELTSEEQRALEDLAPSGVVLFGRNLKSVGQTRDLIAGLRELAGAELWVALDQEGGLVNRLKGLDEAFARIPPARYQAQWPQERLTALWTHVGRSLYALGFDVDFAPVVDLDAGTGANAIGARSYSVQPSEVVDAAAIVLDSLSRTGVAGCLKHFPGLGETDVDTHRGLAVSPLTEKQLWDDHARPYRELADASPFVMTAHAAYPEIDGDDDVPATFSARLLGSWLRERIEFDGVIVTDDLEMGAIADVEPDEGLRAWRSLEAGCDIALYCHGLDAPRRARDLIADRIESEKYPLEGLIHSVRRRALQRARFEAPTATDTSVDAFHIAARQIERDLA